MDSAGISFPLPQRAQSSIKPIQQQPSVPSEPALMPSHHGVLVLAHSMAHFQRVGCSIWGFLCTPTGSTQPGPALAELPRTHPGVSQQHCRAPDTLIWSQGTSPAGALAAAPAHRAQAAPLSLPCWPKLQVRGGATPRMDAVFGLFLHHPHCPGDDSPRPCGHQKSLAGESTAHLHFSPPETRTSSITDSRAAVTSTQMGVNTMQHLTCK